MRRVVVASCLALAAAGAFVAVERASSEASRVNRFDPVEWRRARPTGYCADSARRSMVDDVVHRIRPGLSIRRLRSLLGPPDFVADGVLSYQAGAEPDYGALPICLYLDVSTRGGRVTAASIYRDY